MVNKTMKYLRRAFIAVVTALLTIYFICAVRFLFGMFIVFVLFFVAL